MTDATEPQPRPARNWTILAVLAAGVFLYVLLVNAPGGGPSGTEGPAIGRHLEYLQLEGLTGGARSVSLDDLQRRVTLVNYWGTWCPPCLREFPDIVELHQRFASREDFRLYAVSCGQGADPSLGELREQTEAFLSSRQVALPTYADQNGDTRRAMMGSLGLSVMSYPTTLVLDQQGAIRGFWEGYDRRYAGQMSDLIEQLFPSGPKKRPPTSRIALPAIAARRPPGRGQL